VLGNSNRQEFSHQGVGIPLVIGFAASLLFKNFPVKDE
jgi:hypothetical protein